MGGRRFSAKNISRNQKPMHRRFRKEVLQEESPPRKLTLSEGLEKYLKREIDGVGGRGWLLSVFKIREGKIKCGRVEKGLIQLNTRCDIRKGGGATIRRKAIRSLMEKKGGRERGGDIPQMDAKKQM